MAHSFVAGSLLGLAAGLMFAPKSGEDLREDFRDACSTLSDKTEEFGSQVRKKANYLRGAVEEDNSSTVLMGSLAAGALIGAAAAMMLARKPGKDLRRDLQNGFETVRDNLEGIKDVFDNGRHGTKLDTLMGLAEVGMRAWDSYQKRR